jgi:ABC-2 type transport system permease protein
MKTYIQIIRLTWEEMMEYRLNFIMWRVRFVMQRLVVYFLWWALFASRETFFDYTQSTILTYILLSGIVATFVTGTRVYGVGELITRGDLSNTLIKPINFFSVYAARDTADKLLNLFLGIIEVALLLSILRPPVFVQTDVMPLVLAGMAVAIGTVMYYCYAMIHGLLAFWLPDVWAPRFLSFVILEFLTGALFPLDILPEPLSTFIRLLPFQYFMYFPVKVYLGQLTVLQMAGGMAVGLVWVGILWYVMAMMWRRGLRKYAGEGR